MKKFIKGLMAMLMTFSLVACGGNTDTEPKDALERIKEQGYITFGTSPDYAPNEFYMQDPETGERKIVGSDIALAQAIADKIGVELVIQESDFNTVILNAQAGIVDFALAGFAWTAERAEVVAFSDDYARSSGDEAWQGLMVRKEDVDKYPTKESFRESGAKVGAQAASIQYEMAKTIADEANIIQLADTTNVAAQLSTYDIDAFVCTSTQAFALMETYTNITILPMATFNMDPDNYFNRTGAIFSLDEEYASLIEVVNEVIAESKEVDPETGKSMLDVWYEEATDLMPFDITELYLQEQAALAEQQDTAEEK